MKQTVRQDVKIALFAILFLVAAVLSVLALTPEHTDVEVRREFTASGSMLSGSETRYLIEVTGALRNTTSKPVIADRVIVRLAGMDSDLVTDEPLLLQPRTDTEIILRVSSEVPASPVTSVSVSVGGESAVLRNPAVSDIFGYAFLPTILTLFFLLLLAHAVTVRVYMAQEKNVPEEQKTERTR